MYTLVRLVSWGRLLREQVPALLLSFVIAELFYKFHSFTLETVAFLGTWSLVDGVIQIGRHAFQGSRGATLDRPTH
ncbi:MAG: hypothetical protein ACRELS_08695 [Candidatus Rokuibacteriota bacterium]